MIANPTTAPMDPIDEISALVQRLHTTQQRLLGLTSGEVDAVVHPLGHSYLLYEAQEKLRLSEAEHRELAKTQMAILNALPAHIALLNAEGVIVSVNKTWKRFATANSLLDSQFAVGQNYLDVCDRATGNHSEEAGAVAIGIRQVLRGEAANFEIQYPCHSPMEKRWFRLLVTPLLENRLAGAVVMHLNITETKRSEARFRRLVDSNAQGMIIWNRKGEVIEANDAYLNLVRYSREDLHAGRINWVTMTPPDYLPLDHQALEEIKAKGACKPYEKEYICKDGSRVPILLGAASFEDNPEEGVCFFIDLTERKKLEQQFFRAQRMESIGTLAGGIAHDLNNILAPIMMSVEILKLRATDPQMKQILKTIDASAKRGADIVRQVLSFARGQEGERVEIQPGHILKDLERIIKDTFPKDIRLQFIVPENAWSIIGDPTQLHQILLNLCVNARDALPNGGTLTVNVENCVLDESFAAMKNILAKAGPYVRINVSDSGTGMSPEVLDKIFEPFFTTKEVGKGTGLGLSTVMALVKNHGGFVNVYSEPGKGTTFKVYLPASKVSPEVAKVPLENIVSLRGNGETVLLVDDEASILTITSQTLQAFGYRVMTATNGADAVALYAEHKLKIALVITDMMMPIMDGTTTIHALLRLNPSVKIIAASGLHANSIGAKRDGCGAKQFLTKPYTAETLLKTIRALLDKA